MKNLYEIQGKITEIILEKKDGSTMSAFIDTADFEIVNDIDSRWYPLECGKYTYAVYTKKVKVGKRGVKSISMHRLIMKAKKNFYIDHINHETLNNRRSNLREVTCSQNLQNRKGMASNNKSGIRGVSWNKNYNKWCSQIGVKGKTIQLGFFDDIKDAEKVAIEARKKYMPYAKEA